jgi:hypothetical protein
VGKTIAIVAPLVDRASTLDKFHWLGTFLQRDGFDPVFVCHDKDTAELFRSHTLPYLNVTLEKQTVDVLGAMAAFVKQVDRPFLAGGPTWGEVMGYDDFLGCCQAYKISGAESLKPDCVVTCIPGAESQTPEDALLSLATWRFCADNHIPRIGLEMSSLANDCRLIQWPADLLLTKRDPRGNPRISWIAPQAYRQTRSLRYVLSIEQSPLMEDFLKQEHTLRAKLGPPGTRFLFLPFHLSFKANCCRILDAIAPYAKELLEANFKLVVSVQADSWRRNLHEREMVTIGMRRWLDVMPGWAVTEGAPALFLALLADAVLAPYESPLTEQCEKWDTDLIRFGNLPELGNLACGISLSQAVGWATQEAEKKEAA